LAAGCGKSTGHDAGGDEPDPTLVWHGEVEPGQCGVSRRITLPFDAASGNGVVAREAGGFALGPWADDTAGVRWLRIDASGELQRAYAAGDDDAFAYGRLTIGAEDRAVQIKRRRGNDAEETFESSLLSAGDGTPTVGGPLLSARWRGTDSLAVSPALDGLSGLFMIGPIAISEPRAALIGESGARVGEARSLAPPDHHNYRCESLVPTEHGVLTAFVDVADGTLRLLELASNGEVALEATLPLPDSPLPDSLFCPSIAALADGFGILQNEAPQDATPSWHFHHLTRDGNVTVEAWTWLTGAPLVFTMSGDTALAVTLASGVYTAVKRRGPEVSRFDLPLAGGTSAIRAEPGALFLDLVNADAQTREIVEVVCN
jgi:hypothetical protein